MGNSVELEKPLLDVENKKTMDTGTGRITVSLHPAGHIHSINGAHPEHGYMTLSPIGQFSNDKWYNSDFVRGYRKQLAEAPGGFGVMPKVEWVNRDASYAGDHFPRFLFESNGITAVSTYYPVDDEQSGYLVHLLKVTNHGPVETTVPIEIGGTLSLSRCSYGQLTEGGPIPVPLLENELNVENNRLSVVNQHLPARADLTVFHGRNPVNLNECEKKGGYPLEYQSHFDLTIGGGETEIMTSVFSLKPGTQGKEVTFDSAKDLLGKAIEDANRPFVVGDDGLPLSSFIMNRNIDYIMSCCSIPVSDEHVCVITDHQLLPLSWNRDAFYMMDLLLEAVENSDLTERKDKVRRVVKGHLLWMFEKAERPYHYWGRAYLTNGYCKDKVFQLDQQCYPLLEICRYHEIFGDHDVIKRLAPFIEEVLTTMMNHKDERKWLFQTGETPADDKVDYPYHFSSQILVWHALNQLAALNQKVSFTDFHLEEWAAHVKKDCLEAFSVEQDGKAIFAYLTDLQGNYQFYHDANDLPTVLAPIWGFCESTSPAWMNTMAFAFTKDNHGGYYDGRFGGLGSVHTPHPWPLGDGQELLFSKLTNQPERADEVWKKLTSIVQWDGLFSEAIDRTSGDVESRHWFSWPGAFISTVLFYLRKG
ncbi:MAG TPA: glycoside hydrolase family 125 protein [Bacillales bacterium]|nr:glycoside hydrolase family 125 protein [Bacillales bacterium]